MAMASSLTKPLYQCHSHASSPLHLSALLGTHSLSTATATATRRQWGGGERRGFSLIITRKNSSLPLLTTVVPNQAVAAGEGARGVTESGCFTVGDSELSERGFTLHDSSEGIDLEQLNSLFAKVGFPRRDPRKLLRALEHTADLLWMLDTRAGRLVAFARATGDGVFHATIWDVVVDPSYQGLGLGKALMERLMASLIRKGISNICLYAEPNVVGFYKPLGFITDPDGVKAMAYSRKPR